MAHGGRRPGAGRPPGSLNKRSQEKAAELEASGLLPLDFLIGVMRDDQRPIETRLDAAKSAAPYVHARLQSTEVTVPDEIPTEGTLFDRLDALLLRSPDLRTALFEHLVRGKKS